MRFNIVAVLGLSALATPAMGWTNQVNQASVSDVPIFAVNTGANYCPAGLQPVSVGGVICCGVPNRSDYYNAPGGRRSHGTTTYVAYGKGADEGVVVYEKGQ